MTVAYTLMTGFFRERHLSVYCLSVGFPVGLYMFFVRLMSLMASYLLTIAPTLY